MNFINTLWNVRLISKSLAFTMMIISFSIKYANAFEYRHKQHRKLKESYKYITISLDAPFSNSSNNISPIFNSQIYQQVQTSFNNKDTYPSNKIGGTAGIGYKSPFFFRLETKLSFITFKRRFQDVRIDFTAFDVADFVIRQFGPVISLYFDFDNRTFITPYVGAGGGFMFTQGRFSAERTSMLTLFEAEMEEIKSKGSLMYEVNFGLRFGSKLSSISIEGFIRKTTKIKLESRGIMFKASFQI